MLYEVITLQDDTGAGAATGSEPDRTWQPAPATDRCRRAALPARQGYFRQRTDGRVITSYSIHYTKLYEARIAIEAPTGPDEVFPCV